MHLVERKVKKQEPFALNSQADNFDHILKTIKIFFLKLTKCPYIPSSRPDSTKLEFIISGV
jgi:hypothetical protein